MAIMITDECINCGACEPECPNNAIYEAGAEWAWVDGNSSTGTIDGVDCCVPDPDHVESQEVLLEKKSKMHS